jgi:hypothetical protein
VRWSVFRMICGSRALPMVPPTLLPLLPKRKVLIGERVRHVNRTGTIQFLFPTAYGDAGG